jgi:putative transposase
MKDDTILEFADPVGISPDPLTDILRKGARDLLAQAVEAEVCDLMARHAHLTDAAGRQRLVRHGHLPEREVMTGIGPVPVKVPRVRDRGKVGEKIKFTSTLLPPYLRRARSVEELLPCRPCRRTSEGHATGTALRRDTAEAGRTEGRSIGADRAA